MSGALLVIDAGTSGVRAAIVRDDSSVADVAYRQVLPSSPIPNFVEFDAIELRDAALAVAREVLGRTSEPVAGIGITNQRASTIVWDRATGEPVGPGVGWQDLRTVGMCLALQSSGLRLAPNASATKLAFLLDLADASRARSEQGELAFGTVETWLAWCLSQGAVHVTDPTNACVTGMMRHDGSGWDHDALEILRVPPAVLPAIVDSSGVFGVASALPGALPLAGLAGDQQASLVGQGCVVPGRAKITFGTGGMLDVCVGAQRPPYHQRGPHGTIPLIAWRRGGVDTWCAEAIALTAGTTIEWLRDDLGLFADSAESEALAASVPDSGGVVFVPAFLGAGTPRWDYGARGAFFGLTRGSGRAELVRAVLEGVAQRGADLVEAAEADSGVTIPSLRVDGGMSANAVLVQALADATGRPAEIAPVAEATTLGAAFHAGIATGVWADEHETAALFRARKVVEPVMSDVARRASRDRWAMAMDRAAGWLPDLSALDF
jgi:glycerol kinase